MDKQTYLDKAQAVCALRGGRLTAQREQVLGLAFDYHPNVVKAYQLLADMQAGGTNVAPPTVYRALDFLVEHGLLHRVEALNGFVLCQHLDEQRHDSLMLVCEQCGQARELDMQACSCALNQALSGQGFQLSSQTVVLTGVCQTCQKN